MRKLFGISLLVSLSCFCAIPATAQSGASLMAEAEDLFSKGRYKESVAKCEQWLRAHPSDWEAFELRGECHIALGQYNAAVQDITRSLQLKPTTLAFNNRAASKQLLGDLNGALADIDSAIKMAPERGRYYVKRASIETDLKQLDKAEADLDTALKLEPKNSGAYGERGHLHYKLKKFDLALADYNKALALESDPELFRGRGKTFARMARYDEALADFNKSMELSKDNYDKSGALRGLADVHLLQEKWHIAAQELNQLRNFGPLQFGDLCNLAASQDYDGLTSEGFATINHCIEQFPKEAFPYIIRGQIYCHHSQFEKAVPDFERAQAIEPGDEDSKKYLVYCREKIAAAASEPASAPATDSSTNSSGPASSTTSGSTAIGSNDASPNRIARNTESSAGSGAVIECNTRGDDEYDKKDFAAAKASFGAALQHEPDNFHALIGKVRAESKLGDSDGAIADLSSAIDRKVKRIDELYFERATLYGRKGEGEKSFSDLKHAVEASPSDSPLMTECTTLTFLMSLSLKKSDEGYKFIAKTASSMPPDRWPCPLLRYMSKEVPEYDVWTAAGSDHDKQVMAHTMIGLDCLAKKSAKDALVHLKWVQQHAEHTTIEYETADTMVSALENAALKSKTGGNAESKPEQSSKGTTAKGEIAGKTKSAAHVPPAIRKSAQKPGVHNHVEADAMSVQDLVRTLSK